MNIKKSLTQLIILTKYLNNIETTLEDGFIYINTNEEVNIIRLIWNVKLNNLKKFFLESSAIEIDLSEFDTSEITTMESMFDSCYYLQSENKYSKFVALDISNFDKSNSKIIRL